MAQSASAHPSTTKAPPRSAGAVLLTARPRVARKRPLDTRDLLACTCDLDALNRMAFSDIADGYIGPNARAGQPHPDPARFKSDRPVAFAQALGDSRPRGQHL